MMIVRAVAGFLAARGMRLFGAFRPRETAFVFFILLRRLVMRANVPLSGAFRRASRHHRN
jgi:hypothetical protein